MEEHADGTSILAALRSLPRQPDDMLRLFDRKDNFLMLGRDAETVAIEYFKSSACLKHFTSSGEQHPFLTMNKKMAAEVIRLALTEQKRRVEVYRPDKGSWILDRKGSPGNLQAFEEECSRNAVECSPVIVGVKLGKTAGSKGYSGGQVLVGVAFIDCAVRAVRTTEFEDDEQLTTLESVICQQGARECLLPAELTEAQRAKLEEVMETCEVPVSSAKSGAFSSGSVEQDLRRLLGQETLHGRCFESAQGLALSSCAGLLRYLGLMSNSDTHGLWSMDWVDAAQFMRLDAGAMRALSVEPLPGEPDRNASLLGVFRECKTAMGARLVRKWLKQPLLSKYDIECRLDLVDAFAKGLETRSMLRSEVLPKMGSDLEKIGRKFAASKAGLQDVVALYYFVLQMPQLIHALQAHEARSDREESLLRTKFVEPVKQYHANFNKLCALVEAAVDLDAAKRHEFVLQPHFTPDLKAADEAKEEVRERIEAHYEDMQAELRVDEKTLKLEQAPIFGYVFRVTRKDEQAIRKVKGLTTLQTKKEGVLFRSRELSSLAEEYSELCAVFEKAQRDIATKVLETTATFCPVIQDTHLLLAELDVLVCFAHVSMTAPEPYVRPTILSPEDDRQRIELRGCRHPCVERMEDVSFIKNDAVLVNGESSMQIVTGPNMGGKSTYIRAVGVNVLLAQVGCFVPCDSATLSITDSILARVGAGDCQARGVSTFMAEMLETATILKGATESSLVIIDELGRGTSTYDGFGLAWAISEHLATSVGCRCLFATHFQELTELAVAHPCIVNRHVSAHVTGSEMTMLFRVEDGPSDQSFGINVAEVVGFPPPVIAAAKRKLAELEGFVHGPTTGEAASRMKRLLADEGERATGMAEVRRLLAQFKELPLAELDVEQLRGLEPSPALEALRKEIRESTNPLVAAVCAQADAAVE